MMCSVDSLTPRAPPFLPRMPLSMPATLRELTETSVADGWDGPVALDPTPGTFLSFSSSAEPPLPRFIPLARALAFSNEAIGEAYVTHWLAIKGADPSFLHSGLLTELLRRRSPMFKNTVAIVSGEIVHFEIDSLKTAFFAKAAVGLVNPAWYGEFVPKSAIHPDSGSLNTGIEGQLRVLIAVPDDSQYGDELRMRTGPDAIYQRIIHYLHHTWGDVRTGRLLRFNLENRTLVFRIEMDSLLAFRALTKGCAGKILSIDDMDVNFDIWPSSDSLMNLELEPVLSLNTPKPFRQSYPVGSWLSRVAPTNLSLKIDKTPPHPRSVRSVSDLQMSPIHTASTQTTASSQPTLGARSHNSYQMSNTVSKERILCGQDVRTTIMLRNIPNRIDVHQFKSFLDRTSFGRYDFSYLRIDFQTNSNVGYAFINFVDANSIIPFAEAISGRQWAEWGSQKTAQISYATIQGRDCLIQKFRNSSVMREMEDHRPKLWYSVASPNVLDSLIGMEEPFPDADNYAKLQRSIDNAAHQGLYPPRTGEVNGANNGAVHGNGNECHPERNRRRTWDRGTLQEFAERLMFFAQMRYGGERL